MEEIKVKIKGAEWHDVIGFIEHRQDKEDKPELYYKLSKLYETYNRAIKLSRHAWFKDYKVPQIEYKHAGKLGLDDRGIDKLKEEIDGLNGIIYHFLMNLDDDIMQFMIRRYTLSNIYNKVKNFPDELPNIDLDNVREELIRKLNKNIFENKLVAKNVMETCYYLLKLQTILKKLASIQTNKEIEKMLQLISHTKIQLKQIVDDLGCKLFIANDNEIEIAKRLPDGTDKTLFYTPINKKDLFSF